MDHELTPPEADGGYLMVLALTDLPGDKDQLVAEYLESLHLVGQGRMRWGDLDGLREVLWKRLVDRACRKEVEFRGVRDGATEPSVIQAAVLLRGSKPDYLTHRLEVGGVVYHAVGVFPTRDVTTPNSSGQGSASLVDATPNAAKARLGPEPRHGDDFVQEMIRFALTPDGFQTRKELERHMKDWCTRKRGDDRPDDRTIERWVARYCPRDVPAK